MLFCPVERSSSALLRCTHDEIEQQRAHDWPIAIVGSRGIEQLPWADRCDHRLVGAHAVARTGHAPKDLEHARCRVSLGVALYLVVRACLAVVAERVALVVADLLVRVGVELSHTVTRFQPSTRAD